MRMHLYARLRNGFDIVVRMRIGSLSGERRTATFSRQRPNRDSGPRTNATNVTTSPDRAVRTNHRIDDVSSHHDSRPFG